MTTRYHSTSGVLSLNIQLTRSAGANNSPCPNLSYHPTIKTTGRHYYFISSPDNRCSYLIIRLSLFPSSCKEGCSSWFPSLVLTSTVTTIRVIFLLPFYFFTLAEFSCTGCIKHQLAIVYI